jgi:enterochelin esterase-like enzyme
VTAQNVSFHTFESKHAGTKVSFHLYTPTAYAKNADKRFPVIYWLHGSGGGLPGIRPLSGYFHSAMEAGKIPAALVVFVNGLPGGMYCDWKDGSVKMERVIIDDLLPHIDKTFRTQADRKGRVLDGFSMGGYGSARLGFKFPELFSAVSMMGAGPMQPELTQSPRVGAKGRDQILQQVYGGDQAYFREVSPWSIAEKNATKLKTGLLIRQVIGDKDETFKFNQDFHERLKKLGIPHEYHELPGVAHDAMKSLEALGDRNFAFYKKAFSGS